VRCQVKNGVKLRLPGNLSPWPPSLSYLLREGGVQVREGLRPSLKSLPPFLGAGTIDIKRRLKRGFASLIYRYPLLRGSGLRGFPEKSTVLDK